MKTIRTERLLLRGFIPEDVDHVVELNADPAVRKFLEMPNPMSREEAQRWIAWVREAFSGDRGFWAAEEDGRFIGWFHLRPSRDTGETELGYRLRQDAWGRGLATEGSRALIGLAGERVIARTLLLNRRSRAVMERLGMHPVRTYRYKRIDEDDAIEYAT